MTTRFTFSLLAVATVLVAAALQLATTVVVAVSTDDFTAAQHSNTLRVLEALSPGLAEAGAGWTGEDFCTWPGVHCHSQADGSVGVALRVAQRSAVAFPDDVDASEVRITSLTMRTSAALADGNFLSRLAMSPAASSLTVLDLSGSNLTSELPAIWGNLVSLQYLLLSNNNFFGTLPPAWSALIDLREFQLQNNNVSGPLPSSWSTMTLLQTMNADNNSISGTLPSSWSSMASLSTLSLRGNGVCGGVPASWSALTGLTIEADAALYAACPTPTAAPSSSSSVPPFVSPSSEDSSTTEHTTALPLTTKGPTSSSTPTTESPAVLTKCEAEYCVLCPIATPDVCSMCWPGYALTATRGCAFVGRSGVAGLAAPWQRLTLCLVLLVAALVL